MVPTAAAVMASSPISAPVGTTIWPPWVLASAIRSSFSSNAPTLSTTAVLPRETTGATIERTSLLGAHSMTISAASASASIGSAAGTLPSLSSQPRCLSMFAAETAASSSPSMPASSAFATSVPIAPRPAIATFVLVVEPFLILVSCPSLVPLEAIIEPVAVGLDQAGCGTRKVDRQDQRVGIGDGSKELAPRYRRLLRIPVGFRRPVRLAALDLVMHEITRHHRALPFGEDVDAAVAGRMSGCRRQRDGVVERVVVIDQ